MRKSHSIGAVFSLCLICMFLTLSAVILYMGINSYKKVQENQDENTNGIKSVSYIVGKLKSEFASEGIREVNESGVKALVVSDSICDTYIYLKNGYLCEDYLLREFEFSGDGAERIFKADSFSYEIKDSIVYFTIGIDGIEYSNCVAIRGRLKDEER